MLTKSWNRRPTSAQCRQLRADYHCICVCEGTPLEGESSDASFRLPDKCRIISQVLGADTLAISLSARGLGEVGYVAMGWGGLTMASAQVSTHKFDMQYLCFLYSLMS